MLSDQFNKCLDSSTLVWYATQIDKLIKQGNKLDAEALYKEFTTDGCQL